MISEPALLVGGPKDGQTMIVQHPLTEYLRVNIWPEMNADAPHADYESGSGHKRNVDYAMYRKFTLHDPGKTYVIYRHEATPADAVIPKLLQGYKPSSEGESPK